MHAEDYVRDLLMMEFIGSQAKNPHFSMRSYAQRIGVPQSAVSEIIGKKRRVTAKMARKILLGLDVPNAEVERICSQFTQPTPMQESGTPKSADKYKSLDLDTYHLISAWQHFAILSLAETKGFKGEPLWIAKRLGITEEQAKTALELLLRLEMLEVHPKTKKITATGIQYKIDPGYATAALKKASREDLEMATTALHSTQFDQRDFTAMTLCFDPAKMAEAKRMITHFRRRFAQQAEAGSKTEVYKLSIQFFPLSKNGDSK